MTMSGKQRRYLRSLGHSVRPTVFVGRDGITGSVIAALQSALEANELIKVKLQEGYLGERRSAGKELALQTGAEVVQVLGKTILLFRRNPNDPKVELP